MKSARIHCASAENDAAESAESRSLRLASSRRRGRAPHKGVISSSIPTTHSVESSSTWIERETDVQEPEPTCGRADPLAERSDLRPRQLGLHELAPPDSETREHRDRQHDDPHAAEPLCELPPDPERAIDFPVVGDHARARRREAGHALEVGVERVRRAGLHPRRGTGSTRTRPQGARSSATTRKPSRIPTRPAAPAVTAFEQISGAARRHAGDKERKERLAVAERERNGEECRDAEVLPEHSDEIERQLARRSPAAAGGRSARRLGQLTAPRRPMARSRPR